MPDAPPHWQRATGAIAGDLRDWRAAHPDATRTELEATLDAWLRAARAGLLAEVPADVPAAAERCPGCGGARTRTLRTEGDAPSARPRP